ncbi:hypothetical protein D9757_001964 [Collybiopsis confluens]|uniref:DNA mismatch repair protein MSH3 n=1 Tax=Collybiopsis confluens TaxID=2823264 RepID=A0A8H5HXB6_9AGAR|nr:hypothetical protein D9757_001964 [Collybiopsis confluens]
MSQTPELKYQQRLSSYFSPSPKKPVKRPSTVVDLTLDDSDEERPFKKQKRRGESPSASSSQNGAERWRFDPSAPARVEKNTTNPFSAREALKNKLLGERASSFFKRAYSNLDDLDSESVGNVNENRDNEPEFWEIAGSSSSKGKGKQKPARTKKAEELGPRGEPWTPLEKQVLQLKHDNPGTLLMIEVGYKYKFFDEDAKVAAKVLGMAAFLDRNFIVASIPVDRRDIHLRNLLSRGYRVGIVNQVETAALKKVSESRNQPFERKLVHLYTSATYVDAMDSVDMSGSSPPPFLCIIEEKQKNNENDVSIALISICPSTGDVVYDEFEDSLMRLELEVDATPYVSPLVPSTRSLAMSLIFPSNPSLPEGGQFRIERFSKLMTFDEAFKILTSFYMEKRHTPVSENLKTGNIMASITAFSPRLTVALAHIVKHLMNYNVADALLETKFFVKFSHRSHMILATNTLRNLEVFENETDHSVHGSLLWVLDHTKTKFGARLMRNWVGHPLTDRVALQERVDAVEEIINSSSEKLVTLRLVLKNLPDLARGLCRIQYGQCIPRELATLLPAFKKVAHAFEPLMTHSEAGFKSPLLNSIIFTLPTLRNSIDEILQTISLKHAVDGQKDELWIDTDKYPQINETKMGLLAVELELQELLSSGRKSAFVVPTPLKLPFFIAGEEYLVEVEKSAGIDIPASWRLISATKTKARYRPADVQSKLEERLRWQETLDAGASISTFSSPLKLPQIEANSAYSSFLDEISQNHYETLRSAVNKLAEADCLISLAQVGLQPSTSYVRPEFTDKDELEIVDGRHPMIELIRSDPFIPNTIRIGTLGESRSKIITGPNMGGKSSIVRMVALIAIMAQIGSYVPATSVKIGMLDCILTRMGAWDDLARGRSTFMVEMSETSEILYSASEKSLVILDELGRGTSTFDGMAIASAVLQQLVRETSCKTLFITHYPLVAAEIEKQFPGDVQNMHMGYTAEGRVDGTRDITFLYHLTQGITSDSFGVECGRLAGLPEDILRAASQKSSMMQTLVQQRIARNRARNIVKLIAKMKDTPVPELLHKMARLADSLLYTYSEEII